MIIPEEKSDFCQISLTGMRALTMLGLLANAPRSLSEIREKFLEQKLINSNSSDDIIRIDMNTLRSAGCEISRSGQKTDNKHVLTKHPFGLNVTEDEINVLKKAYKIIKPEASLDTLLKYHRLFIKLGKYIFDKELKEELYGISALKMYNDEFLEELINDCEHENTLIFEYKDGGTNRLKNMEVLAQKLEIRNDKVYLLGYDINSKISVMLPVKRIIKILSRKQNPNLSIEQKTIEVKFYLKDFSKVGIMDCEQIIESHDDMSQIVLGTYHNEFIAVQRMLEFGKECVVLEPEDIKQKVIDKLLKMREVYKND